MSPDLAMKVIRSWNADPLMADLLRGRVLVAQRATEGIVVSWREGDSLKVFTIADKDILHAGWTDSLTDLLEILAAGAAK